MKNKVAKGKSSEKECPEEIKCLMEDLGSKDGITRTKARETFVAMGIPAVDYLSELVEHPKRLCRWEALKALGEIADPDSGPLLALALEDEESDVRWLAAEALIAIGKEGTVAALERLIDKSDSLFTRQGVHHVLREYLHRTHDELVAAVLVALDGVDPVVHGPIAAEKALKKLKGS